MTDTRKDDLLDEDLKALSRAYRAAPAEEGPPAAIDDAIRAAARRAVHARPQPVAKTWFSRSSTPLAAAAVLVLTVSVGFLALNDPAVQVLPKGEDGIFVGQKKAAIVAEQPVSTPPQDTSVSAPRLDSPPPPSYVPPPESRVVPPPQKSAAASVPVPRKDESFKRAEPARRDESPPVLAETVSKPAAAIAPKPAPSAPPAPPAPPPPAASSSYYTPPAPAATPAPEAARSVRLESVTTTGSRVKVVPPSGLAEVKPDAADRITVQRAPAQADAKREAAQTPAATVPQASGEVPRAKEKESADLSKRLGFAADPPREDPVSNSAKASASAGAVAPAAKTMVVPAPAAPAAPGADAMSGPRSDETRAKKPAIAAATAPVPAQTAPSPQYQAAPQPAKPAAIERALVEPPTGEVSGKLGASASGRGNVDLSADEWVKRILELRKLGKLKEADEELAKFRKRYPDYVLPEALRETK